MKRWLTVCLLLLLTALCGTACSRQSAEGSLAAQSTAEEAGETLDIDELLRQMTAQTTAAAPEETEVVAAAKAEASASAADTDENGGYYVLNTNTRRFHLPDCESVGEMAEKNKLLFYGSREEAVGRGYKPCQRCQP